jgi:hypothetical protein
MRPQLQPLPIVNADDDEAFQDLGWNDMGLTSFPATERVSCLPSPEHQQASMAPADRRPLGDNAGPSGQPLRQRSLTIRLDQNRHLQLRLAGVLENRSAQQLVRHALDRLLAGMSDLEQPSIASNL